MATWNCMDIENITIEISRDDTAERKWYESKADEVNITIHDLPPPVEFKFVATVYFFNNEGFKSSKSVQREVLYLHPGKFQRVFRYGISLHKRRHCTYIYQRNIGSTFR